MKLRCKFQPDKYTPGIPERDGVILGFVSHSGEIQAVIHETAQSTLTAVPLSVVTTVDEGANSVREGTVLDEDMVRQIRRLYHLRKATQKQLAIDFGVSRSTINQIIRRKTWTWVK